MTTPAEEAMKLQRPLADGELTIVARGEREERYLKRLMSQIADFKNKRSENRVTGPAFT